MGSTGTSGFWADVGGGPKLHTVNIATGYKETYLMG